MKPINTVCYERRMKAVHAEPFRQDNNEKHISKQNELLDKTREAAGATLGSLERSQATAAPPNTVGEAQRVMILSTLAFAAAYFAAFSSIIRQGPGSEP